LATRIENQPDTGAEFFHEAHFPGYSCDDDGPKKRGSIAKISK
jgi:hypothetical protein